MSSACIRFFQIPEMVMQVVHLQLEKNDIACLMETCHQLNICCAPFLFQTLYREESYRIMNSADCLKAFARNSHRVKVLFAGPSFMSLLYNCLLAYQVLHPASPDLVLPAWLPRLDDTLSNSGIIIPIPPMTRLLSFTYFGHGVDYLENQSPSSKYNTVRQAQVYGVLHYSSQLRELSLDIDIDDLRDTQLLAAAISRMLNLQKLRVESLRYDWSGNKFIPTIVECCPSSLVDLIIDFHTFSDDDPLDFGAKTEEEKAAEVESVRFCMPLLWEENGVSVIPRQGQLDRLHRLVARQLGQLTIDEIFSVFKQCPNLTKFFGPELSKDIDPLDVAMCIGRHCQKVNWLAQAGSRNPMLLMDIMDALSTQTVEVFFFHTFDKSSVDLASRILRHSGSLREIRLENCQEFNSRAIQTILVHCHALEEFICQGRCNDWEMKFDLADAIEFPWGSTRLKCLHLLIAMDHIEPTPEGPFYERVPPINLTDAEDIQMSMLKKLYHQIGRLVDMEVLTMRLIVRKYPPAFPTTILFPGMWSLPRGNSGQLGYLHLFASLKKLRVFISNMDSDKTIKLIGQPEVEWIAHNWPSLQRIDFFRNPRSRHPASPPKPSCFQWLKEQMPQLKMD